MFECFGDALERLFKMRLGSLNYVGAECCPCFGTQLDWRNLNPQESEELARARAYHEKLYPRHPSVPYGLQRMERVKTIIGVERLCNQLFRELGIGEPTRAELRAERREERNQQPQLSPRRSTETRIGGRRFASVALVICLKDVHPVGPQ